MNEQIMPGPTMIDRKTLFERATKRLSTPIGGPMGQTIGHMAKIGRAFQLLSQLHRLALDWYGATGEQHYMHWTEADPETPGGRLLLVTAEEIPIDPFSLLIGEILHNIRGSLDHCVFALSQRFTGQLTWKQERQTQFPICNERHKFNDTKWLELIEPAAKDVIERFQPYNFWNHACNRQSPEDCHPLWWLSELSNADKHRILNLATSYAPVFEHVNIARVANFVPISTFIGQETVVAKYGELTPADPSQDSSIVPQLHLAFADGVLTGHQVIANLALIAGFVDQQVLPELNAFL